MKVKELYMTKLLNSERLQHSKPIREGEMAVLVRAVWDGQGAAQEVRAKLQVRAFDIISRMMLGKSFHELSGITMVTGRELFGAFCESLSTLATPVMADFLPLLKPLDLQRRLRLRTHAAFELLDAVFQRIVDHRRRIHDGARDDLLATLLELHVDKAPHPPQHAFTDDNVKAIFWVRVSPPFTPHRYER
jgi:cytochrome P450